MIGDGLQFTINVDKWQREVEVVASKHLRFSKPQDDSFFNVLRNPILYRIASRLCAVVCIVSCVPEAPEVPARSTVFTETYRAGLDLLERHRLLAAERAFERCVALLPEAYKGHWQLDRLRLLQGRIDEGIEGLARAGA